MTDLVKRTLRAWAFSSISHSTENARRSTLPWRTSLNSLSICRCLAAE